MAIGKQVGDRINDDSIGIIEADLAGIVNGDGTRIGAIADDNITATTGLNLFIKIEFDILIKLKFGEIIPGNTAG